MGRHAPTRMTVTPIDRFAECIAPASWQAVDVISDLHLQAGEPDTFNAWLGYLQRPAHERADALFILGDLFEVWVGDDVLGERTPSSTDHAFWRACAQALRAYSDHAPVYFMAGNRDFLVGPAALDACGMQRLSDPSVLVFHGQRWGGSQRRNSRLSLHSSVGASRVNSLSPRE